MTGKACDQSLNISFDLIERATAAPHHTALLIQDQSISYGLLNELTWRVSTFLHSNDVRPGDVVGISSQADLHTILLMLGITRIGATVFSLPKSASAHQIQEMVVSAKVTVIVSDHSLPFATHLRVIGFHQASLHLTPGPKSIMATQPEHPWIIISGSGTTGKPRMIPISHHTQRVRSQMSQEWLGLTPTDRVASLSHFDFTHPKNRLLETLWAGASYALGGAQASDIVAFCNANKLTVLHATVFHVQRALASTTPEQKQLLPHVRVLGMSASTVNHALRLEIREKLTKHLVVRYAANETGPISYATDPEVFEQMETVGKPLKGVNVTVLDDNLQPQAPPNEPPGAYAQGTVAVDSPANFQGYLDAQTESQSKFTPHGFLPGDMVRLDAQKNITFLGRADQMMIFNGINIYPAEVERTLATHSVVGDVVCFPLFHPTHQDVPVAAVSLKPGTTSDETTLLRYCRERLGAHSPHRVFILDEIPRNERGKVVRSSLADLVNQRLSLAVP